MRNKLYWAIVPILILTAAVFIFFILKHDADPKNVYIDIEPAKPERDARDGYKWENHGDHWHEVPISNSFSGEGELATAHKPQIQNKSTDHFKKPADVVIVNNPNAKLTYHTELLKTNPVEALRLQSKERGHINAKWIPPFPHDDIEAQALAKSVYHFIYNRDSGNQIQIEGLVSIMHESERFKYKYGSTSARCSDLDKLSWVILTFPMSHYYGDYGDDMGKFNGWAQFASDYFPDHISEMK